jgi:hypothetical protein
MHSHISEVVDIDYNLLVIFGNEVSSRIYYTHTHAHTLKNYTKLTIHHPKHSDDDDNNNNNNNNNGK